MADTTPPATRTDSTAVDSAPPGRVPDRAPDREPGGAPERAPNRAGGQCYRFVFGAWNPPLDAKAAGHAPFPPADSLQRAPGGRDWAFSDSTAHDLQLMLYPAFWPAGVSARFPRAPRSLGDTVRGRAIALVADGRVESPEAEALAWLVPCDRR